MNNKASLILEHADVLTQHEMAEQFDCSVAYVRRVLRQSGQNAASLAHQAEKTQRRARRDRVTRE